ncbi:OLC1v1024639C1 [Oldenlandia corymbosa var. corymbosa]|uniref:Transcriptional adapter n=1 Tax=Oldenlandia corymbosa var. corymbosa TaxID=529605 RepID=A0AAV1C5P8_OLDCO|nr:OLC1v1024639C1 [Oldenlandia corymbosa var. corymbosa]
MGRSRAVPHSADEDSGQRSKRKKTASNVENVETVTAAQGKTEGKALYHCNYCNKDISGKVRIKCAICSDFDLCVECFSIGAEVHPHKSGHPYRVMDNLSFPLICPDWNADEEILLLEGTEMYGLGNWAEVAEHVGTKRKSQCIEHYNAIYMNSPCFPLPDMSHVMGKNREELLAMASEHGEVKMGYSTPGGVKDESLLPVKIKVEDQRGDGLVGPSAFSLNSELGSGPASGFGNEFVGGAKRASSLKQSKDEHEGIKIEDVTGRSFGEKKPRTSGDEGPSIAEFSGYNFKRQEFEIEYDNDAEQLLADMEFKENDTNSERELKLRVLRIYSKRLDERKCRKDFILERGLLYPDNFEKELSREEKDICQRYRVFMRFHSKEEHEELLRSLVEEHRVLKRIQDLQEARAAGCLTSAEAERFIKQKRGEADDSSLRATQFKGDIDSPRGIIRGPVVLESGAKDIPSTIRGITVFNGSDHWDVTGFLGADLLSEAEKRLCGEIRILPAHYLNMLQTMSMGVLSGSITKSSDAYGLFNVDPTKVDKIYDVLVRKGIGQA